MRNEILCTLSLCNVLRVCYSDIPSGSNVIRFNGNKSKNQICLKMKPAGGNHYNNTTGFNLARYLYVQFRIYSMGGMSDILV